MWQPRVLDTKALGAASFAHPLHILCTSFVESQSICLFYFADMAWGWSFYILGSWGGLQPEAAGSMCPFLFCRQGLGLAILYSWRLEAAPRGSKPLQPYQMTSPNLCVHHELDYAGWSGVALYATLKLQPHFPQHFCSSCMLLSSISCMTLPFATLSHCF